MCEADSTTYTESNSTVCYDDEMDESHSDNNSLSSRPMFIEDTDDTDNELPYIESAHVEDPDAVITEGSATGPDGRPMHSNSDKCKCAKDSEDKVIFDHFPLFPFYFYSNKSILNSN